MKLLLLVFLVIMCAAANALTETEIEQEWQNFKVKFDKKYANTDEEARRREIFTNTLQRIDAHNKRYEQKLETYQQGVNKFADWTEDEFKSLHGVRRPTPST